MLRTVKEYPQWTGYLETEDAQASKKSLAQQTLTVEGKCPPQTLITQ